MATPRLFVLGSYVQALCLQVATLPRPGESLLAQSMQLEAGGKGLNLAIGARRLGAEVDVLVAAGRDAAGDALHGLLQAEGIATGHLLRVDAPSGHGIGFIDAHGQNSIAVYPGANAWLGAVEVRAAGTAIAAADLVCAQMEIAEAAIVAAFAEARRAGVATLLNAAPYRPLPAALLALIDTLVLNAREAESWLGLDSGSLADRETAVAALGVVPAAFAGRLVVTLGAQGCVSREADGSVLRQAAFAVEAVDTVGAGDAFCAGLAVALGAGRDIRSALREAAACGAIVCAGAGVLDHLPDRDAVLRRLGEPG
ncbi:MAG: PfkB family carbohydrate kinase [Solimonas sp.]